MATAVSATKASGDLRNYVLVTAAYWADTLTDGIRSSLLRLEGYRVDVVQFVESQHTPRNTMLRAVRTGGQVRSGGVRKEYDDLVSTWSVQPRLSELLGRGTRTSG